MALQDITTKILDDAKTRATEIVQGADVEIERLKQSAKASQEEAQTAHDADVATQLEQEERAALSRARRSARQVVSDKKRALIDDVRSQAIATIVKSDDTAYATFLDALLKESSLEGDFTAVHAPSSRIAVTQSILKKNGMTTQVVADDTIDAGLVFVGTTVNYDLTLARRIDDMQTEIESIIVNKLFSV